MFCNFSGKVALITGGTRGIGLASGLAFGRMGATCVLTYLWGSKDEDELRQQFAAVGAPEPLLVQADISQSEDTDSLLAHLKERHLAVDIFISNATVAPVVQGVADLTERALLSSIRYGVWPTVEYLQKIKRAFDRYPRYVIAMSTTGIDTYTRNYDLVATAKATLETLCRYLAFRLRHEDCRINCIRTRAIRTESMEAVVGKDLDAIVERTESDAYMVSPEQIGETAVALCSGYLDQMNGQVLTVDRGGLFCDNLSRLYTERERLGL